jgi:hypothetical protein
MMLRGCCSRFKETQVQLALVVALGIASVMRFCNCAECKNDEVIEALAEISMEGLGSQAI